MPIELRCNQTALRSIEMTIESVRVCVLFGGAGGGKSLFHLLCTLMNTALSVCL